MDLIAKLWLNYVGEIIRFCIFRHVQTSIRDGSEKCGWNQLHAGHVEEEGLCFFWIPFLIQKHLLKEVVAVINDDHHPSFRSQADYDSPEKNQVCHQVCFLVPTSGNVWNLRSGLPKSCLFFQWLKEQKCFEPEIYRASNMPSFFFNATGCCPGFKSLFFVGQFIAEIEEFPDAESIGIKVLKL